MKIINLKGRHPILEDAMAKLRNKDSNGTEFRTATGVVSRILSLEAMKIILPTRVVELETPLCETMVSSVIDTSKKILLVPILRSGLAMLPIFQETIPNYDVGFVGQKRDEITAEPKEYYCNIPVNHESQDVYQVAILDPMIATGGSAVATVKLLVEKYKISQRKICLVSIVAAPEGLSFLGNSFPGIIVITAAIDEYLNNKKFIVPGLGDFGDRYFGSEKPEEVK